MKANSLLIRVGVFFGLLMALLLMGCQTPSGQTASNDTLLTDHPTDPAMYPFPQNTPAPGRW
jgi:hypothetical protein